MAAEAKVKELEKYLRWTLDYVATENGIDEQRTPVHYCDYKKRPDKGYCAFHDMYWSAREILEENKKKEATNNDSRRSCKSN